MIEELRGAFDGCDGPVAAQLAPPPFIFKPTIEALGEIGLPVTVKLYEGIQH